MATANDETIELESQPLNSEKKAEIFNSIKNDQQKEKTKCVRIGLTKEELMKYAQDPFWCKLRKILFFLFWLLWLSMFVGAFLIIHYVPSCPATSRLKWYQKESALQVEFEKLFDNKFSMFSDSKNIDPFMNVFQSKTLILPNIFNSSETNDIVNHLELNTRFGSQDDLSKGIQYLKVNHEANVIMDFNAAVTSRDHLWFKSFLAQEGKYTDYYLIADSQYSNFVNYETEQLNNGKGKLITKSGRPVLNLLNDDVKLEFKAIFEKWSRLNIKGFRLLGAPYLLIDPTKSEKRVTKNDELNQQLIKEWNKELKNLVSDGVIIVQLDDQDADSSIKYFGSQSDPVADIVVNKLVSKMDIKNPISVIRDSLHKYINSLSKWNDELNNIGPWTGWLVDEDTNEENPKDNLMICFANILGYILPRGLPLTRVSTNIINIGTPSLFFKVLREEINDIQQYGTYDNARIFSKLNDLRKNYADSIMLGKTEFVDAHSDDALNDDVFVMIRSNDKKGLIVIANVRNASKNVTLKIDFNRYPRTAQIAASCNIKGDHLVGTEIHLDQPISLRVNETFVATFDLTN